MGWCLALHYTSPNTKTQQRSGLPVSREVQLRQPLCSTPASGLRSKSFHPPQLLLLGRQAANINTPHLHRGALDAVSISHWCPAGHGVGRCADLRPGKGQTPCGNLHVSKPLTNLACLDRELDNPLPLDSLLVNTTEVIAAASHNSDFARSDTLVPNNIGLMVTLKLVPDCEQPLPFWQYQ